MIDIIIPAYNAHDTIKKTLASIALQKNADKLIVYIIDDCSKISYEKECELFKDKLNIKLYRLEKNMGPGHARQYGMQMSKSKYIIFMDSDDTFYSYNSCETLFNAIEYVKYDVVSGKILEICQNDTYVYGERFDVLHAKIYRRSFLKRKDVQFPDMYNSEDEAFNNFLLINNPKIGSVEDITYVYKRREKSLTMQKDYFTKQHIKSVCENLKWTVNLAEKKKCDKERIAKTILNIFGYLYYYFYTKLNDKNLAFVYEVLPVYNKYKKYINKDEEREIISYWVYIMEKFPIEMSFEEFMEHVNNKYKTDKTYKQIEKKK